MSSVKTYLYDPEREAFVTPRGALSNMRPTVAYCDYQNWSLSLRTGEGDDAKAFVIPPDVITFTLAIDRDKKEATTPMIRATNDMITLSADRSILDFTVDAATEEAKTVLDGQTGSIAGYFELCGLDANARRVFRISFAIDLRGAVDPSGLNYPTPGLTATPDIPATAESGDYVRRMAEGVRSWGKIACATVADITSSILSHNTDKSAHKGVLIPEVPNESALFVRQGSGVGEWRWFKTSEGVIFGTDLYNHKISPTAHTELFATRIENTEKGIANGVASLDENAKIPISQIPDCIGGGLIEGNFGANITEVEMGGGLSMKNRESQNPSLIFRYGEGLTTEASDDPAVPYEILRIDDNYVVEKIGSVSSIVYLSVDEHTSASYSMILDGQSFALVHSKDGIFDLKITVSDRILESREAVIGESYFFLRSYASGVIYWNSEGNPILFRKVDNSFTDVPPVVDLEKNNIFKFIYQRHISGTGYSIFCEHIGAF